MIEQQPRGKAIAAEEAPRALLGHRLDAARSARRVHEENAAAVPFHGSRILATMPRVSKPLAARLAPLTVLDERGRATVLGSAWEHRPAVVAFVRHFG